jgi:hypothetical protein
LGKLKLPVIIKISGGGFKFPQGLPLGRKLSQFFGLDVLIMTSPDFGKALKGPGKLKFSLGN